MPRIKTIKKNNEIVYLIRQFYRIQEHRIALGGQIRALKEQNLETNPLDDYFKRFYEIEKDMVKYLKDSIKNEKIYTAFLKKIKGIGPILASGLINLVDIKRARHISSLWKFAGIDVAPDGKGRSRRQEHLVEREIINRKGKKEKIKSLSFNPLMKCLCWKIGKSFVMTNSPYRKYYDQRKEYEKKKHPELKKFHIDRRAQRYMVKRFLADFWLKWREMEGLPISLPYVCDKLGHKFQK